MLVEDKARAMDIEDEEVETIDLFQYRPMQSVVIKSERIKGTQTPCYSCSESH